MKSCSYLLICFLLVTASFTLSGCSDSSVEDQVRAQNATNIQKLSNAYKLYAYVNGHVGPESKDELKQFLKTNKAIEENLKFIGIELDKLDSYFVSEADGEQLVFRWGVEISPVLAIDPIVFDKTGAEGMRRIMLACDVMLEVEDDDKYERLLAGNIDRNKDVPASVFGTDPDSDDDGDDEDVDQ